MVAEEAACRASEQLAQLEQDLAAAATAATEALKATDCVGSAAAAKATAAMIALHTALKWPAAAAAAGGGPAATPVPPAAAALLEQLQRAVMPSSLQGSQLQMLGEKEVVPAHQVQQVWHVQAQPAASEGSAASTQEQPRGGTGAASLNEHAVQAATGPEQQQQQQPVHAAEQQRQQPRYAAEQQLQPALVEPLRPQGTEAASLWSSATGRQDSSHMEAANQGTSAAPTEALLQPQPHADAHVQPPSSARTAAFGSSVSNGGSPVQAATAELREPQPPAMRVRAAAAAMLGKQSRALARAQQAGEWMRWAGRGVGDEPGHTIEQPTPCRLHTEAESVHLRQHGWLEAAQAAEAAAVKWRKRCARLLTAGLL